MIKVKAKQLGYYGNRLIDTGEEFVIKNALDHGSWMEVLEPEKFEKLKKEELISQVEGKIESAKKLELDKAKAEVLAEKLAKESAEIEEVAKKKVADKKPKKAIASDSLV